MADKKMTKEDYNQGNPMSKPKQKSRPKNKDNRKRK